MPVDPQAGPPCIVGRVRASVPPHLQNFLGVTKKKKCTRQEGHPYQADHRRSPAHGSDCLGFLCHPQLLKLRLEYYEF